MSNTFSQAVMSRAEIKSPTRELDLSINAVGAAVVRVPFSAGAMNLRAPKTVLTVG